MLVSGVVFTHHLPEEAMPWIVRARTVFDEIVIFIDEQRATPGTVSRAEKVASRVLPNKAEAWYGADGVALVAACRGDWFFTLDYDEQLGPEWEQDEWRQILKTTEFTHFSVPRHWMVSQERFIADTPWWPDFQPRLFRKNLEGTIFPRRLHDTTFVPGSGASFQNLTIQHHVLWMLSRAQREEKVRLYEQLRPGNALGHYYLYEDWGPAEVNLRKPANLDIHREVIHMDKLSPEAVSKVSLEVSSVPQEVHVSEVFWLDTMLLNGTSAALHSVPSYPTYLAYHWIERTTRQMVEFEGRRSGLWPGLEAGATRQYRMMVIAPNVTGNYILQVTAIQEKAFWFEDLHPGILKEFFVAVTH